MLVGTGADVSDSRPLRIAQVGDLHFGTITFDEDLARSTQERINAMAPDVVVVVGDLTAEGYEWEFDAAAEWLDGLDSPRVVVPGNHDARNLGYLHFERLFGERFPVRRLELDDERAAAVDAPGLTVVGLDSSEPDVNLGRIGREWYGEIPKRFAHPDDVRVFVVHHHLVSIPGTGRERSTIVDAGEVLDLLSRLRIDLVLSGHKHVPFFWAVNGMLVCNSGTASTHRVRGLTPPSFNEIEVCAESIKVFVHYPDGRRELAAVRKRTARISLRDSLQLTDEFLDRNRVESTVHG